MSIEDTIDQIVKKVPVLDNNEDLLNYLAAALSASLIRLAKNIKEPEDLADLIAGTYGLGVVEAIIEGKGYIQATKAGKVKMAKMMESVAEAATE